MDAIMALRLARCNHRQSVQSWARTVGTAGSYRFRAGPWNSSACITSNPVQYMQSVNFWSTSQHPKWGGRLAIAGLMLSLWVGTFALTVSPELHRLLHQDAQGPDHNCLITQIQQHPLLTGVVTITAPAPASAAITTVPRPEVRFLPACDYGVSPSRAPPLPSSSPTVVG
jgi:hypothetical protein